MFNKCYSQKLIKLNIRYTYFLYPWRQKMCSQKYAKEIQMYSDTEKTHQWPSASALKIGRREMAGRIFGCSCRLSRSKFYVVFSETRLNTD